MPYLWHLWHFIRGLAFFYLFILNWRMIQDQKSKILTYWKFCNNFECLNIEVFSIPGHLLNWIVTVSVIIVVIKLKRTLHLLISLFSASVSQGDLLFRISLSVVKIYRTSSLNWQPRCCLFGFQSQRIVVAWPVWAASSPWSLRRQEQPRASPTTLWTCSPARPRPPAGQYAHTGL